MHSAGSTLLNAPVAGVYLIAATRLWTDNSNGFREVALEVNSNKIIAAVEDDPKVSASVFSSPNDGLQAGGRRQRSSDRSADFREHPRNLPLQWRGRDQSGVLDDLARSRMS